MTISCIKEIEAAAACIEKAEAILISAGAGMGVDSGLPDFRGDEGFWKAYPPFAKLGLRFVDMANPYWFEKDPDLAWGFYGYRLNLYTSTMPHKGFGILLGWGQMKAGGYFVFTSNVDGQFQKAGFASNRIEECHGSIHYLQCADPCSADIWPADELNVSVNEETMRASPPLPVCHGCGTIARPNILMFGDWNWISHRTGHQQKRFQDWLQQNRHRRLVIVECGAGTAVPTVRSTSEQIIRQFQATLIRINLREPETPEGHISLPLSALEALTRINNHLTT